jgi:phage tail sheath gpL-like
MSFQTTTFPSSFRAPYTAIQLVLGAGASNAPVGAKHACYLVPILSTGQGVANTRYEITAESDASTLFGPGSSGHRIARMHIKKNPTGRLFMIGYAPSSGSGLATAEEDFTIVGAVADAATGSGSFILVVCGFEVEVVYRAGDTETAIGDIVEAKINGAAYLPVTADNTAGVVTISAKCPGASQNSVHRIRVKKNGDSGSGLTVSAGAALLTGGAEGAVTELTGYEAALTVLQASDDYYLVTPVTVASFITAGRIHTVNQNSPIPGKFCRFFYPQVGTRSAAASIAITQNSELCETAWQRNPDQSPDEIVAWYTASKQREESTLARFNFDNYAATGFLAPSPATADWPTLNDINDAINDGLAPIVSTTAGTYLAMGITNRSKDSAGLLDDPRASESHRIAIMHEVGTIIRNNHRLTYVNFAQEDDPRNADGTINETALQTLVATRTDRFVTPSLFLRWFRAQLAQVADARLQQIDEWIASAKSRIDPQNNGRMQNSAAGRTVDLHHQASFRLSETTPN